VGRQIVGIAELKRTETPEDVLVTLGLGSCVVVAVHDRGLKLGALAHIMLPYKEFGRRREGENMHKYADVAIPAAIRCLEELGGRRSSMTAKIVGGSCMFDLNKEAHADIGRRNIEAVKKILVEQKMPLLAEDTGGNKGRSIEFRVDTGDLLVRTVHGGEKII
jgi:chemotaxis protein CheD